MKLIKLKYCLEYNSKKKLLMNKTSLDLKNHQV